MLLNSSLRLRLKYMVTRALSPSSARSGLKTDDLRGNDLHNRHRWKDHGVSGRSGPSLVESTRMAGLLSRRMRRQQGHRTGNTSAISSLRPA